MDYLVGAQVAQGGLLGAGGGLLGAQGVLLGEKSIIIFIDFMKWRSGFCEDKNYNLSCPRRSWGNLRAFLKVMIFDAKNPTIAIMQYSMMGSMRLRDRDKVLQIDILLNFTSNQIKPVNRVLKKYIALMT